MSSPGWKRLLTTSTLTFKKLYWDIILSGRPLWLLCWQPIYLQWVNARVLNVKALVGAFYKEKALVGAFSVIVKFQTLRRLVSSSTRRWWAALLGRKCQSATEYTAAAPPDRDQKQEVWVCKNCVMKHEPFLNGASVAMSRPDKYNAYFYERHLSHLFWFKIHFQK